MSQIDLLRDALVSLEAAKNTLLALQESYCVTQGKEDVCKRVEDQVRFNFIPTIDYVEALLSKAEQEALENAKSVEQPAAVEFAYIKEHYGVPADIGRRVTVDGKPGVIVSDFGHYIGVRLDGAPPDYVARCHPTWRMEYGEMESNDDK